MKKTLLTVCLMGLLTIGLAGCSSNSSDSSSSSSSSKAQESQSQVQSSSEVTSSSETSATYAFKGQKAIRIRYENVHYTTRLDNDYQEERLYQKVPGSTTNNRVYHWDSLNVSDRQDVYVDKKAIATFKDDDNANEYDHEDFYRISFGRNAHQKYWASDDVIENEANEGYDD